MAGCGGMRGDSRLGDWRRGGDEGDVGGGGGLVISDGKWVSRGVAKEGEREV